MNGLTIVLDNKPIFYSFFFYWVAKNSTLLHNVLTNTTAAANTSAFFHSPEEYLIVESSIAFLLAILSVAGADSCTIDIKVLHTHKLPFPAFLSLYTAAEVPSSAHVAKNDLLFRRKYIAV